MIVPGRPRGSALTSMVSRYEAPTWPSKWPPAGPLAAGLVASLIDINPFPKKQFRPHAVGIVSVSVARPANCRAETLDLNVQQKFVVLAYEPGVRRIQPD